MHIRPCTIHDRAGVIALWERVFPDDPPHNAPAKVFDAKLAMRDGMLFVATDADTVIGTAMAGYDGHRGWLYAVAVLPGHRRRGIGAALVRHAVGALRKAGCAARSSSSPSGWADRRSSAGSTWEDGSR